jgi:hypothetical protein
MAKYDEQLNRMMHLMEYDNKLNESKQTNNGIECHKTGADGKEYGIIKEGMYYYIKTSTPDKKNIAESYDYLNGFNRRNETRYNSYNTATKQLELHLMNINEAYGKHEDVTIANVNSSKEAFAILTEDARKELDRMHAIFENSFISKDNIGNHGNPQGKGSSTGANTTKNNTPFEEKAEAKLDKVFDKKGTVEGATSDHTKVGDADNKLQHADKMERGKSGDEGYKDAHDDLEGESIADKKPKGAKAVKMNESFENDEYFEGDMDFAPEIPEVGADEYEEEEALMQDPEIMGDDMGDDDEDIFGDDGMGEDDIVGLGAEEEGEDDLDALLREFLDGPEVNIGNGNNVEDNTASVPMPLEEEDKIVGPDPVLDGPHGKGNSVHGEKTMDRIEEATERITKMVMESLCNKGNKKRACKDSKCTCDEEPVNEGQGWRMIKNAWKHRDELPKTDKEYDETFDSPNYNSYMSNYEPEKYGEYYDKDGFFTKDEYDSDGMRNNKVNTGFTGKLGRKAADLALKGMSKLNIRNRKKELKNPSDNIGYLQEAIDRIVKEEVTKLNLWGKHPRYRKEPMSTPSNTDVKAGTADKDWCDDSVKGGHPYGEKIGSSAPYDKEVDILTEKVFESIKRKLSKKSSK